MKGKEEQGASWHGQGLTCTQTHSEAGEAKSPWSMISLWYKWIRVHSGPA